MGISLGGVAAWTPDDQLAPGSYIMRAAAVERVTSSNGNPQVKVEWCVDAGSYRGAQQNDWITFTEKALGNVAAVLAGAGIETPAQEFDSYEQMADWFAQAISGAVVEAVIRLEPSRKDPSKEWPTIKGYRKPSTSDIPDDGQFRGTGPTVAADTKPLPF